MPGYFGNPEANNLYAQAQRMAAGQQQQQQNDGSTAGGPGSYTGGPDAHGYGGAGELAGGGAVNLRGINVPYFQQDRDRLGGLLNGKSPYASQDWGSLISQLTARANGTGPSVAQQQYQQAMGDTAGNLAGMAHGGASPASFRTAALQMGQTGQGMAAGSALARTQEMQSAQSSLQGALGTRDQLNQSAYLNILAQQLGLSEAQLRALQGDQNYAQGANTAQNQANAAKYQAIGTMVGTVGGAMVGGPAGAMAGGAIGGKVGGAVGGH